MRLQSFPNCCTARILIGLGNSDTAGYIGGNWTNNTFVEAARNCIREAANGNAALIFAITNSDQTVAMECLPQLGFVATHKDVGKLAHQDKTLTSWVYQVTGADKRALPIPVNPFAKPAAPVVAPVVAPEAVAPRPRPGVHRVNRMAPRGLPFQVETVTFNGARHEIVVGERHNAVRSWLQDRDFNRPGRNDVLRARHRRDAQGRFQALPVAGKVYTLNELRDLFIPNDMRYRRIIVDTGYVGVGVGYGFMACRKTRDGYGMDSSPMNDRAVAFVFA